MNPLLTKLSLRRDVDMLKAEFLTSKNKLIGQ